MNEYYFGVAVGGTAPDVLVAVSSTLIGKGSGRDRSPTPTQLNFSKPFFGAVNSREAKITGLNVTRARHHQGFFVWRQLLYQGTSALQG